MLNTVAQLAQHIFGHVSGVLGHEIDPHALGTDQPRHLFHLVDQGLGRIVKQQVRFVKKEHKFGFVGVADLGQFFEQFAQQPQQERRIEPRAVHQFIRRKDVDLPAPVRRRADHIIQFQRRFPEQGRPALIFKDQQLPLDRTHRG